ncbi:IclR family transcriptional regulator [Cytobacillus depressus]|uniref:IclR family transcriptional regulator n=1 Tax=Cytobacillus depressus TaxID=1602942 RepID=A0A6L3V2M2_9BACI|nr:IclR family transcriptional regulator [Cytobacillus depressus]KAB2333271.1 IclR family transcriptional regulator [Cytobacillus depressus]
MNQSVIKALRLLQYFTLENPKRSLADISKYSGLAKPTAYRMLRALEEEGFLMRNEHNLEDKDYQLGLRLFELGNIVAEGMELRKIALPYMEELRNEINEVVHLVILDRMEAVYVERVETDRPMKLFTRIGLRTPLYAGSAPRLLLAFMKEQEQEEILKEIKLSPFTESTVKNIDQLRALLKEIKANGYSISYGEFVSGTLGMSVPIKNHTANVIGSLTVAIPGDHFQEEKTSEIIERLLLKAEEISRKCGFTSKVT